MSNQRKFCEAVAAELKADEVLNAAGNVTVSIEDEISAADEVERQLGKRGVDRKSTRLNSSHVT